MAFLLSKDIINYWSHAKNVQKCEFFKNHHVSMRAIGSYFSNFAPISSPGLKTIQTDKTLD